MWCPTCGADLQVVGLQPSRTRTAPQYRTQDDEWGPVAERIAQYACPLGHYSVCRHEYLCPVCNEWCVDPLFHHPPKPPNRRQRPRTEAPNDGG